MFSNIVAKVNANKFDPFFHFPELVGKPLEECKQIEYYPFIWAINIRDKVYPQDEFCPDESVMIMYWNLKIMDFNSRAIPVGVALSVLNKCWKPPKKTTPNNGFGATINFMKKDDDEIGHVFQQQFINFCKSKEIKNYYIAIEYGKNNNNAHAHLYLDYYDRRKSGGGVGLNETAKPRSLRYELHKLLSTPTDIQVQHNPRLGAWYQYCKKPESNKKTFFEELQTNSEGLAESIAI